MTDRPAGPRCAALVGPYLSGKTTLLEGLLFDSGTSHRRGTVKDGNAEVQPVWLTAGDDNPNAATVRFLADGAELPNLAGYTRVVMLFDGQDPDAVDRARAAWKTVKAAGHDATYWQQSERGRWEKKG